MTKRGKIPSLISGCNGKPRKVRVGKKRACNRCKQEISKDFDCYEIPKSKCGFTNYITYCKECFTEILIQTQSELDELKKYLD